MERSTVNTKTYDSVSADLFGYCDDYLQDCSNGVIAHPNKRIYDLCADYIISPIPMKEGQRKTLITFFLNRK